jgi:hypothetical protein
MHRMHVARFAVAFVGAMAISFVAGQLSVARGAVVAADPPSAAVCATPSSAPEPPPAPPLEAPSPYGFNQPG